MMQVLSFSVALLLKTELSLKERQVLISVLLHEHCLESLI